MTYLAIPIKVESASAAKALIDQAVQAKADIIELRLDYLADPTAQQVHEVIDYAKATGCKVLATCRAPWEGGSYKAGEKSRNATLKQAARAKADFIDIESTCRADGEIQIEKILHKSSAKLIRSNHDFEKLPADLNARIAKIDAQKPDIAKIAYNAQNISDCFAALDFLHEQDRQGKPAIAMAMGQAGMITRLLAKKLNAFLTFASLDAQQSTAPGQVSAKQMRQLYRFDQITADTKTFGVIGSPIDHSMSPAIHNAAFDGTNFNGLYIPLLVTPTFDEFAKLLDGLRLRPWLHMTGLSVTIPHKENALRYLQQNNAKIEPLAAKIGAVNTIIFHEDSTMSGYNTDYPGAIAAIMTETRMKKADFQNMPTAILGAGGVARALVAGLTDLGAKVTIYNRTVEKAERLAEEFNCSAAPLDAAANHNAKLIINCTSLGMTPNTEQSPLTQDMLTKDMIVFDTVYNPLQTKLLQYAAKAQATTVDGLSMFVNQAAEQFKMFTKQPAPTEIMRQAALKHLGQ